MFVYLQRILNLLKTQTPKFMKKCLFFSIAVFAILFAYSVKGQNFVKVDKTNRGQSIQINQDQVLEIKLPRKAGTGYIWVETSTTANKAALRAVAQIGDGDFIKDPGTETMHGGPGTQIIRYVGVSQGTTVLTFELKRPWLKNNPPIDDYTVTITSSGKYTGTFTPSVKKVTAHTTSTPAGLPSKVDWRPNCTPVKNQNQCGDCWAFAGVAYFENTMNIIDHNNEILSEEWMTNCYTADNEGGCGGGYTPVHAWLSPQGAVYESEDPWTASEGAGTAAACGGPYAFHETVTSNNLVTGASETTEASDSAMKRALYTYGVLFTYVDASSNAWSNYTGGIFTETGNSATDHCVAIVGYVDSAACQGGGYWIVRNSWAADWGVGGYILESYGSDYLGQGAAYVVYKGGIPYAVPPVASFTASVTTSCTGTIQFTDGSSNSPTSWAWNFGDGTTSTLQSPSHTYTTSGSFTVKLTATNSYGNNTTTQTNYITINLPTPPSVTGASTTQGGSVTLTATGSGTLNWYNAATGGTLVNTGGSYNISPLNTTETFYVENDITSAPTTQSVGMAANTTNGSYYTGTSRRGLKFDALAPFTLISVTVYANTAANRTIFVKNSSGVEIDSLTTSIASGTQTVTLNFSIPVGTGYTIGCSGSSSLWRETSGAVYPYTLSGVVSITGNTTTTTASYYYFYNWQVQGAGSTCTSPRVPVVATVTTGINEYSKANLEVFPSPNDGEFTVALNNLSNEICNLSIENIIGQTVYSEVINNSSYKKTFNLKELSKGVYTIKLSGKNNILYKKMIIK